MYLRVHCKEQYTVQLQGHMVQISVRSSGNIFVILNSVKELKVSGKIALCVSARNA